MKGSGTDATWQFGINGLRNEPSHLVGPLFLAFRAHFSNTPGWHFPGALIEISLRGGYD